MRLLIIGIISLVGHAAVAGPKSETPTVKEATKLYRWKRSADYVPLASRVSPPAGFQRVPVKHGSYAWWLRHLPAKPQGAPVKSFRGNVILKPGHRAYAAVVDWDLGRRDRQQCMDSVMRLRGEYLFWRGKPNRASFPWAGGIRFRYRDWRKGLRPKKEGRRWQLVAKSRPSHSYRAFRRYLGFMFSWTGTIHQLGERRVKPAALRAGDFFVQAGSPGHAVVILDLATHSDGRKAMLLAQGFIPAQDLHVLRSPKGAVWFEIDPAKPVQTPLWRPFRWRDLRRFRD